MEEFTSDQIQNVEVSETLTHAIITITVAAIPETTKQIVVDIAAKRRELADWQAQKLRHLADVEIADLAITDLIATISQIEEPLAEQIQIQAEAKAAIEAAEAAAALEQSGDEVIPNNSFADPN